MFDVEVEINAGSSLPELNPADTNHIYRIVRETITNANRHANARHIWIDIVQEPGRLVISITNDGRPLPPKEKRSSGLGTQQINMRTRLLGGAFSLSSLPDQNTLAELIIPLSEKVTS